MDGQGTTWRRNIAENFNRLSRMHQRYRRQTDRQTDRRWHIANMNLSSRSLIIGRSSQTDIYSRLRPDYCPVLAHPPRVGYKWDMYMKENTRMVRYNTAARWEGLMMQCATARDGKTDGRIYHIEYTAICITLTMYVLYTVSVCLGSMLWLCLVLRLKFLSRLGDFHCR